MKETRKQKILKVSAKLFRERGYNAVTVRDIAEEMGIKAASLYNHVASKQEILATLVIEVAEAFTNRMNEVLDEDSSPAEKIEKFIALHVAVTIESGDALASLNKDWMHLEGTNLAYFSRMRQDYESNFMRIIKLGIKNGDITASNPEIVLLSLLSTLRSLYLWYDPKRRKKIDSEELVRVLTQISMNGILN